MNSTKRVILCLSFIVVSFLWGLYVGIEYGHQTHRGEILRLEKEKLKLEIQIMKQNDKGRN